MICVGTSIFIGISIRFSLFPTVESPFCDSEAFTCLLQDAPDLMASLISSTAFSRSEALIIRKRQVFLRIFKSLDFPYNCG